MKMWKWWNTFSLKFECQFNQLGYTYFWKTNSICKNSQNFCFKRKSVRNGWNFQWTTRIRRHNKRKMKFPLACLTAIVIIMATGSNGETFNRFSRCSNIFIGIFKTSFKGGQNGCAWSGCQIFPFSVCSTGLTGESGRPIQQRAKLCQGFGQKGFCCDEECGYQECGKSCEDLGMKRYWEMDPIPCEFPFHTFSIASVKYFCCP